jgi:hypothetical protein
MGSLIGGSRSGIGTSSGIFSGTCGTGSSGTLCKWKLFKLFPFTFRYSFRNRMAHSRSTRHAEYQDVLPERPEPDFFPPPETLFSVAHARRSASAFGTPRFS